jgi:6-phosphogluconolactonase/glucosamine-6-phosphate isomerase/deaminase
MFDALARIELPWNRLQVFQVDERVAPDDDRDRNATQLTNHLLRHVTIRRSDVHLMGVTARSLQQAANRYAVTLGDDPLDIVHLGIGEDGHTASWPPGDAIVDSASAVAICDEYNGRVRMTLTPRVVNAARARLIFVTGSEKASPLASWLVQRADLPITRVRRTGTTLVLDSSAASQLAQR